LSGKVAIACAAGGFKGVFLHGVLASFEEAGFRADAYGAASSSVIPAAAAAVGLVRQLGVEYWLEGLRLLETPGNGMSQVSLTGIKKYAPRIITELFKDGRIRFTIAVSEVDAKSVEEIQGSAGRRLGRQLLLDAARGNDAWITRNLTARLFDTEAEDPEYQLTSANINDVTYASSRMLHAWDIPAWIAGRPFVDSFYTCSCPAEQLAALGYSHVIALATEPVLYRDILQRESIPEYSHGAIINIIAPEFDPVEVGVGYTTASVDGLKNIYGSGMQAGTKFLDAWL